MSKPTDMKLRIGLVLSLSCAGLVTAATGYVLQLLYGTYPDRLWLGRFYWPSVVLFVALVPLTMLAFFHFAKQSLSATRLPDSDPVVR